MTGLNGHRVYLDWNATAPLRPEARAAMLEAMEVVGNPSSVHAEGRAAKKLLNQAREQVAGLVGCDPADVIFTSGATEGAGIVCARGYPKFIHSAAEHDCLAEQVLTGKQLELRLAPTGEVQADAQAVAAFDRTLAASSLAGLAFWTAANNETGVIGSKWRALAQMAQCETIEDAVQVLGKRPMAGLWADYTLVSGHKIGGPKGVGALLLRSDGPSRQFLRGGGQERGRRAGTENLIGIAGFGAAAAAAKRDLEAGVWDGVERLRNILESTLVAAAPDLIIFGKDAPRLPNTSCFAVPGWRGETQVMQMDLAGFAVSAGSACSSGKVGPSRVLRAMGYDEVTAASAIRVSLGPTTTEAELLAFADAWSVQYRRHCAKAA
ncbi:MAG: aminotransferase class V-fold PLP-dependent enzyme [Pseudomonadota bacterium]